ncbi:unnamed protein product [Lactuca saligna]|uniref:Phytocyanin domain-containing protein n=1 Tax=Lactuca saligna TaxID=75948 RepID=A0AA35Z518_LACSI|nr:unnamed protein product [Lactuca saligna]
MTGFKFNLALMMALMLASVQFQGTAAQTTHVVGNALGWNIPPNGPSAYTTWASTQTFRVGNVLLFNFRVGNAVETTISDPMETTSRRHRVSRRQVVGKNSSA